MRTYFENSRQGWVVFIDDPQDPALLEFDFPPAATLDTSLQGPYDVCRSSIIDRR